MMRCSLTWAALAATAILSLAGVDATSRAGAADPLPPGAVARFGQARLHHGAWIKSLAFSPDGRMLASGGGQYSQSGDVSIWDVASGRLLRSVPAPKQGIGAVAFSPDGKAMATAGMDRIVRFWDPGTGKAAEGLRSGAIRGNWVAFHRDGKTVVVCDGMNISVVDGTGGVTRHTIKKASHGAFSPDGEFLATTSIRDPKVGVKLWYVATGKLVRSLAGGNQRFAAPAFSGDGLVLAAGCTYGADRGTIVLWNVADGKVLGKLPGLGTQVTRVAFSPNGRMLASASRTTSIRVWDVRALRVLRDLPVPGGQVYTVAFSPDGAMLAAGGLSGQVHLWRVGDWTPRHGEVGHWGGVVSAAIGGDGRVAVTAGVNGTMRLWRATGGAAVRRIDSGGKGVSSVVVSPDGRRVVGGGGDGVVRVWDVATGALRRSIDVPPGAPLHLAVLPPTGRVAVVGSGGVASEVDLADGRVRALAEGKAEQRPRVTVLSADGRLAASSERGSASVWRVRGGRRLGTYGAVGVSNFYGLALDPTGRLLACDGGRVGILIELDSGKVVRKIVFPNRSPGRGVMAMSLDGRVLAATEANGTIGLWSVRNGEKLGTRAGHRGKVNTLRFLPGRRMLSGSADGTAILWGLAGIDRAKSPASRPAVTPDGLQKLWDALASTDATKAQEAIFALLGTGPPVAKDLGRRLRAARGFDAEDIDRWVAELGHAQFAIRERATEALARAGASAEPALRRALKSPPGEEVRARAEILLASLDEPSRRTGPSLRRLRAIHVLEQLNTNEARDVLRQLSAGPALATVTRRAAEALERLANRR